jgi:prepilin-type N-terminal cleavage/methylation domain-containing protein
MDFVINEPARVGPACRAGLCFVGQISNLSPKERQVGKPVLQSRPAGGTYSGGFTLVELLVVIAIIGILIGLTLPAVEGMRETARRVSCANNLARIGLALQNYDSAYGSLPPGTIDREGPIHNVARGYHMGWIVHILPYLDENPTYKHVDFAASVYDKANAPVRGVPIALLICPSSGAARRTDPGAPSRGIAVSSYVGCHNDVESPIDVANRGVLFLNSHITERDVTDGTANTIYVGEKFAEHDDLGWMSGTRATLRNAGEKPKNTPDSPAGPSPRPNGLFVGGFGSAHAGVCNFLFGDSAVRHLSADLDLEVLQQLANRADGRLLTKGPTRSD